MIKHSFEDTHVARRACRIPTSAVRDRHRKDVARWALANGQPLTRDALAVIIGTREITTDAGIDTTWTIESVTGLLTWQAGGWCGRHRVPLPEGLGESLSSYLRYLSQNRLLGEGSNTVPQLIDWIADLETDIDSGLLHPGTPRWGRSHGSVENENYGSLVHLIPKKSSIPARPS